MKLRGTAFRGGWHDYTIRRGGLVIFPRLEPSDHRTALSDGHASTGATGLDALLGGGLVRGTNTLLVGPSGAGKTSTATSAATAALQRGERVAYFVFDEGLPTLLTRSAALGMDLQPYIDSGLLSLRQIDPAEMSPGQFAVLVREAVEHAGSKMVIIDSLNAYLQSMPGEQYLILQMHELLSYLNDQGAITLMILGQHGLIGDVRSSIDLSYLADSVVLLRYFEVGGMVRKAISVLKTRTAPHETTVREFTLGRDGLRVGEPLHGFRGVLSGRYGWSVKDSDLMRADLRAGRMKAGSRTSSALEPTRHHSGAARPRCRGHRASAAAGRTSCRDCADLPSLLLRLDESSAVMVTEEVLVGDALDGILRWVEQQPAWSDLAFIVLSTKQGQVRSPAHRRCWERLGNAVLLERPLNAESLASSARTALRARRRQIAMRDLTDTLESRVEERTRALLETEERFRTTFEGFPRARDMVAKPNLGNWSIESATLNA